MKFNRGKWRFPDSNISNAIMPKTGLKYSDPRNEPEKTEVRNKRLYSIPYKLKRLVK